MPPQPPSIQAVSKALPDAGSDSPGEAEKEEDEKFADFK
jgi:hypothetical protein